MGGDMMYRLYWYIFSFIIARLNSTLGKTRRASERKMADVVRSGAIFRVRGASSTTSAKTSPLPPHVTSRRVSRSRKQPAAAPVVRRVAVSALEAASSSSLATISTRSSSRSNSKSDAPETPAGMPHRKARLQQTPSLRSSVRKVRSSAEIASANPRNAAEIEANFNRLVMKTPVPKQRKQKGKKRRGMDQASVQSVREQSESSSSSSESEHTTTKRPQRLTHSTMKSASTAIMSSSRASQRTESLDGDATSSSSSDGTATTPKVQRSLRSETPQVLRSSARVRAQQKVPDLPPRTPIRLQHGNTEEDEELLHIQKRLFFNHRPKRREKSNQSTSESEYDDGDNEGESGNQRQEKPRSRRGQSSSQSQRSSKTTKKLTASVLEEVAAPPKAKKAVPAESKNRSKLPKPSNFVLCDWTLRWPPVYEELDDEQEQIQLVLEGQVLGHPASFKIARRVSTTRFISSDDESVRLEGELDIAKAERDGVPSQVIEIMAEGVPTHWRRKFESILNGKTPVQNRKRKQEDEESEYETGPEDDKDPVTKGIKRSRSGRIITPVMDWWRGERLTTDVNGVTAIELGSPAFIETERKHQLKTAPVRSSARKPPRVPKAPTAARTPITAKKIPIGVKASTTKKAKQATKNSKVADEISDWSELQLRALADAKMHVPTTAANFWAEVATYVPGKTANECRTKSFEEFASPTNRPQKKRQAETPGASSIAQIPTKIHRAGSNLFKKQVRQFVQQYEKKHVDDLFSNTTPSKSELQGTTGLDDIKSPGAPLDSSVNLDDSISTEEDLISGRELLEKITSSKRDEVDSYVLSLKRNRLIADPASTPSSKRAPSFQTPGTAKKKKPTKRAVHMYTEVGSHRVEGVVSPGGTTHVRIQKDSDATSEDEDEHDSDEAHSSDDFF
ncbi:Myb-like domain, partial [Globisporangium splendens]